MKLYKAKYRTVTEDTVFIIADNSSDADRVEDFMEMEESIISRSEWRSTELTDLVQVIDDDDPDLCEVGPLMGDDAKDIPTCPKCGGEQNFIGIDTESYPVFSYACGAAWSPVNGWIAKHIK